MVEDSMAPGADNVVAPRVNRDVVRDQCVEANEVRICGKLHQGDGTADWIPDATDDMAVRIRSGLTKGHRTKFVERLAQVESRGIHAFPRQRRMPTPGIEERPRAWRAFRSLDGKKVRGPWRRSHAEAMNDLSKMQQDIVVPPVAHSRLPRGVFKAYYGRGFRARVERGGRKVSGPPRQTKETAAADYEKLSKVRTYAALRKQAAQLQDRAKRAKR